MFASPMALAKDKVVLSLQQDPASEEGLEPSCVALQLGIGLLMSGKADVTIFATLDGVYIGDEGTYGYDPINDEPPGPTGTPICDALTPPPNSVLVEKPLGDILVGFLNAGGEILLCPLCYAVRQEPERFEKLDAPRIYVASPIPLLLEANKVIDY